MDNYNLNVDDYSNYDLMLFYNIDKGYSEEELLAKFNDKMEQIMKCGFDDSVQFVLKFNNQVYRKLMNDLISRNDISRKINDDIIVKGDALENKKKYEVNPINPSEIKQIIAIDSLFRDEYNSNSSTDFVVTLPFEFKNVIKMKLISAEIPTSEYIFSNSKRNNALVINFINLGNTETHTITIPDGSWYSDDITTFINNFIDTSYVPDDTTKRYLRYLFFYVSSQTGRSFFRLKNDYEIGFINSKLKDKVQHMDTNVRDNMIYELQYDGSDEIDDCNISTKSCLEMLGFNKTQSNVWIGISSTFNFGNEVYVGYIQAENIYSEEFNTYYFLYVNDYNNNTKEQVVSCLNNNYIGNNILSRIQIKHAIFNINIDNNDDNIFKSRNYFRRVNIKKLHIKLINKYGRVVDLNKSNISLALELTQLYNSG